MPIRTAATAGLAALAVVAPRRGDRVLEQQL